MKLQPDSKAFTGCSIRSEKLKYSTGKKYFMDIEEIAKKYSMRELKPIAKKYGIAMRCAKKIEIVKAFPPEALAELEQYKK
jgi:hypothetical protein